MLITGQTEFLDVGTVFRVVRSIAVATLAIRMIAVLLFLSGCIATHPKPALIAVENAAYGCGALRVWILPSPDKEGNWVQDIPWITLGRINVIVSASERYCHETGSYASSLIELREFAATRLVRQELCLVDDNVRVDEWGGLIQYSLVAGIPEVRSAGSDRVFGTADDVLNPLASNHTESTNFSALTMC